MEDAQLPHVHGGEIHGDEAIACTALPGKAVDGGRKEAIGNGPRGRNHPAAIRKVPCSGLRQQPIEPAMQAAFHSGVRRGDAVRSLAGIVPGHGGNLGRKFP